MMNQSLYKVLFKDNNVYIFSGSLGISPPEGIDEKIIYSPQIILVAITNIVLLTEI